MFDAALEYAARGWHVFPIAAGGKTPLIGDWPNQATTDPDTIRSWWTRWPDANVGVATGRESGVFVLDVDVGPGKHGDESIADLQATFGDELVTLEALTGGGGRHLWFEYPDDVEIRNSAGLLGPGLDVRGEGGYVVVPPSTHPSGGRYEWELGSPEEPVAAPGWLLELLAAPATAEPRRERLAAPYDGPPRPGDRFAAAVTWPELLEADGATCIGTRVDRTTGERYELWSRPPMPGETAFVPHTSATLYYKGSDVLKVFSPNWRGVDPVTGEVWALEADRTYDRFGFYAARYHGGDLAAAARELGRRQDDEAIAEMVTAASSSSSSTASAVDVHGEPGDDVGAGGRLPVAPFLVNYGDLWAKDGNPEDWLCEPLIAGGRGHALYAVGKTGKSLLALYVAACLATGRPVLRHPGGTPTRVLYLDYEMTEDDLRERLESFGFGPDDAELLQANLAYALLPSLPPLDTEAGGRAVVTSARALDVALVVIDTTARAVEGDENSADTYRGLYRNTGLWLKQAGIAYLRLDHAGKDAEKGQRGSSAKADDVDVVWRMIRRDGGQYRLTATHRRMSWVPAELDVTLVDDDDGDGVTRFTTAPGSWPDGTKAVADALDELGAPLDVSRRAAAKMLRDAGIRARNAAVLAAIRYRRQAVENLSGSGPRTSGTTPGPRVVPDAGDHSDANRETPSPRTGPPRGPLGTTSVGPVVPGSPPLRGDQGPGCPVDQSTGTPDELELAGGSASGTNPRRSTPGTGTAFHLDVPAVPPDETPSPGSVPPSVPPRSTFRRAGTGGHVPKERATPHGPRSAAKADQPADHADDYELY